MRVCPETIHWNCSAFLASDEWRQPKECESVTGPILEILRQSTTPVEPGESAFDDPASGQNLEALGGIRTFDDFNGQPRQYLDQFGAEFRPLVTAVSEELFQKRIQPEQGRQNIPPSRS
jgi:hypothetical protein